MTVGYMTGVLFNYWSLEDNGWSKELIGNNLSLDFKTILKKWGTTHLYLYSRLLIKRNLYHVQGNACFAIISWKRSSLVKKVLAFED